MYVYILDAAISVEEESSLYAHMIMYTCIIKYAFFLLENVRRCKDFIEMSYAVAEPTFFRNSLVFLYVILSCIFLIFYHLI